jgi:hypothetical protein
LKLKVAMVLLFSEYGGSNNLTLLSKLPLKCLQNAQTATSTYWGRNEEGKVDSIDTYEINEDF